MFIASFPSVVYNLSHPRFPLLCYPIVNIFLVTFFLFFVLDRYAIFCYNPCDRLGVL